MNNKYSVLDLALIVATDHDFVTKELFGSSKEAAQALVKAGYTVLEIMQETAIAESVWTKVQDLKWQGGRVLLASISAHGGEDALYDSSGAPLLDRTSGRMLSNAIVLLQACLLSTDLPHRWISSHNGIKVCVGFAPYLFVPRVHGWQRILLRNKVREAQSTFRRCLCTPVYALIHGKTVGKAKEESVKNWQDAATSLFPVDKRVALVFEANAHSMTLWGDDRAKLHPQR